MYKQEYRGLIRAIARVYLHDRCLMALAGRLRDYYVHGAVLSADAQPFSEALRCERNGAHDYLEKVFAEIKGSAMRSYLNTANLSLIHTPRADIRGAVS